MAASAAELSVELQAGQDTDTEELTQLAGRLRASCLIWMLMLCAGLCGVGPGGREGRQRAGRW
jgi:hypothetical protein